MRILPLPGVVENGGNGVVAAGLLPGVMCPRPSYASHSHEPDPPDNSSASEGDIWPVNDPPVVLSADATPHDSIKEEGEIQPVNDPVVTLRKSDP